MVVDTEEQCRIFQEGIHGLDGWSKERQMLFNKEHEYTMDDQGLDTVESEKDVGVLIHKSLKPSLQCTKAATEANQVLGQLARAVTYRDKDTFLKLYRVYVHPHLEYAVQSWSPYTLQDKEVLEKVQRRAVKMVSNMKGRSYEEMLAEAGMTTLETRRLRGDQIQMYKIMSGKDDVNQNIWFKTMADNRGTGVGTRQATGLYNVLPQKSQSQNRTNFFSLRVVAPWNALPNWVKEAPTVNTFKNRLDKFNKMQPGVFFPP